MESEQGRSQKKIRGILNLSGVCIEFGTILLQIYIFYQKEFISTITPL